MTRLPRAKLQHVLMTFEEMSGLEACVSFPPWTHPPMPEDRLDWVYHAHHGRFCEIVKSNTKMKSCGGYDYHRMNAEARRRKKPFVNTCHAGATEIIVPIIAREKHIATIFSGQAITLAQDRLGFSDIARRVSDLDIDLRALRQAYNSLPRISAKKLRRMGDLLFLAVTQLAESMSDRAIEQEIVLRQYKPIQTAIGLMKTRLSEPLSAGMIAEVIHLNPAYFSRLFKRITRMTVTDYLTELRIERAKRLLRNTQLRMSEIAHEVGYSRQSYFARKFRDVVGVSPSQFRSNVVHTVPRQKSRR
ncbi:MAG: helix-turn-helix domain-containing protein [Planctomycetes bacterium]|nr:helix-turn-helix domain-containing protein [Planctomycetota bacterium]